METIINLITRVYTVRMKGSKKQKPLPEVSEEAIVKPEEERPEVIGLKPEQMDSKEETEYEQMKSAEQDMDGDDNPDVDPEA